MNEGLKQIVDAVSVYQRKKAALQVMMYIGCGSLNVVMFVVGYLSHG